MPKCAPCMVEPLRLVLFFHHWFAQLFASEGCVGGLRRRVVSEGCVGGLRRRVASEGCVGGLCRRVYNIYFDKLLKDHPAPFYHSLFNIPLISRYLYYIAHITLISRQLLRSADTGTRSASAQDILRSTGLLVNQSPESRMINQSPESRMINQSPEPRMINQSPEPRMINQSPEPRMINQSPEPLHIPIHQNRYTYLSTRTNHQKTHKITTFCAPGSHFLQNKSIIQRPTTTYYFELETIINILSPTKKQRSSYTTV